VAETVAALPPRPRVLELGASHGGFTELLLALDCDVTMAEMAAPALRRLEARHGGRARFAGVHDPELALDGVGGGFALAVAVSALHHVPDYLALLGRVADRIDAGGALITLQDPLWYPRTGRLTRLVDRSAYLAWRLGQGRVRDGAAAAIRRLRRRYPERRDDEVVYYHVVRSGVDEEAVAALLAERFARVELVSYWSHHLAAAAGPATAAGLVNTFAVRATGRR
jgi:SAM-dependent methyltransferase